MALTDIARQTLEARYFLRDEEGNIIENEEGLWDRVAIAVANVETEQERDYWYEVFYGLMNRKDFLPNTPTLMNAGKENGQLSACFVLPIEDSMEGIFETLKNAAIIHKTGGGTGFSFSSLRPEGSMVSNKTGVSTGPLSFAQVYNAATGAVKQGSSRRGANMLTFDVHHPDILQVIDMKMTPGAMTNFNVSITVTDEFMRALDNDEEYELRHPYTGTTGTLSAKYVWDKIAENAWKFAEPGIIFIGRVNAKSPYRETIVATNPCGEQPLPPFGSCNLGSINLSNFVTRKGEVDWARLAKIVRDGTRFLDNVIDANCYPIKEIEDVTKRYRNIGLGIMGWAGMLIKLKVGYNTTEAIELARSVQRFINETSHHYSSLLAQEKGLPEGAPFPSPFDYAHPYRRNATVSTVAPTGTISMIAGCDSGLEAVFAFIMTRYQLDRVMEDLHPLYKQARNNGGVDPKVFVDSHSVSPEYHVRMQAAFQENCDSAISKTINLPSTARVEDVKDAYRLAYNTGCKGVTVYRDGSREGVLHRKDEPKTTEDGYCTECGGELRMESGCETCMSCGISKCLIA